MITLEQYFETDHRAYLQEVKQIDDLLELSAQTFIATSLGCDQGKVGATVEKGWPYKIDVAPQADETTERSHGTLAMVLTATGRLIGKCKHHSGHERALIQEHRNRSKAGADQTKVLKGIWSANIDFLCELISVESENIINSGTFGNKNPITVSHVIELYSSISEHDDKKKVDNLKTALENSSTDIYEKLNIKFKHDLEKPLLNPNNDEKRNQEEYCENAFVPVRALRVLETCNNADELSNRDFENLKPSLKRYFESELHDQLSFSSIPDSRFDPAQLVFCLEGLLMCGQNAVDEALFDRVLHVLRAAQETSAHWRPTTPFRATSQGGIMLPVSVEVANSLMRSIELMDVSRHHDTYTAKSIDLLQRFWVWLQARAVRFERGERSCIGWHSEHVNSPNLVHIWDTSQVVEFMIMFRAMLERNAANKALVLSNLDIERQWQSTSLTQKPRGDDYWKKSVVPEFEPLAVEGDDENAQGNEPEGDQTGAQAGQRVYALLDTDFYQPWYKGESEKNYSMLLYGPPGTGKSTVAENLAKALGMAMITVTVSDFLGAGGANVEARAKAIFQTLELQDRCVILFDEIDSFLLDRDSELYKTQDSLFQFLTPGMLTKINDLRKKKRCIFIIATNYANRIDPAIKRTGRIDKKYLLPLPNALRREKIMGDAVQKKRADVLKESVFMGYSDLKGAADDSQSGDKSLQNCLRDRQPSTSLRSYIERIDADDNYPLDELVSMFQLAAEVWDENDWWDNCKQALRDNGSNADLSKRREKFNAALKKAEKSQAISKGRAKFLRSKFKLKSD